MGSEGNTKTFTVDEKDGALILKDEKGVEQRYVKESDLLAVKGSREGIEKTSREAEATYKAAVKVAEDKAETERQRVLQAEARVSSLEEKIAKGEGSAAELAQAKQRLEAAKRSGEELGNRFLELRRNVIVATYGVPRETVEKKSLEELEVYEEALRAVMGARKIGNFAIAGGGGAVDTRTAKEKIQAGWDALHPTG